MNKKEFLARIDVLLAAKHWSKARLNEEAGLPTGMIYQWYQSQSDQLPTVKSIEAVCRALGVTLSQFFMEREEDAFKNCLTMNRIASLTEAERDVVLTLAENLIDLRKNTDGRTKK